MSEQIIRDDLRGDAEIARLRLQAAHAEVERLRLTDAEREAIRSLAPSGDPLASRTVTLTPDVRRVLHGLLTRTGGTNG